MSVGIQVFQLTAAVAIIISAARQNAFGRWRGVQLPAKAALVVSNGVILRPEWCKSISFHINRPRPRPRPRLLHNLLWFDLLTSHHT